MIRTVTMTIGIPVDARAATGHGRPNSSITPNSLITELRRRQPGPLRVHDHVEIA